ncbi:MAG: SMI1/KNR4 family protein [Hyphomonadaceae bacterium]|nr:SMI1/KNR4 family protein [Hyphomonadaceae bacterium]
MTFDDAFDHWCETLRAAGFAVGSFLNAPATDATIDSLQAQIGFDLPNDLRALYLRADGQTPPFGLTDPFPGEVVLPFFGTYDFISTERALGAYEQWKQIFDEAGDQFSYNFDEFCTVRDGDPVIKAYWQPGWLPFSIDGGGNSYAVDLSPPSNGSYGQVILIGPDEDERRVLAPSLCEFLIRLSKLDLVFHESSDVWRCFDIERLSPKTTS